jgi:hypothetical protein
MATIKHLLNCSQKPVILEVLKLVIGLGLCMVKEKCVQQDYSKATEFYKKACDMRDVRGCFNLGFMYEYGDSVRQDRFKAMEIYKKVFLCCNNGMKI